MLRPAVETAHCSGEFTIIKVEQKGGHEHLKGLDPCCHVCRAFRVLAPQRASVVAPVAVDLLYVGF
ncbi:hypothetical protein DMH26_00360 [Streptomyces sp. WAC 05379]|nr:hypothetical protein DMH26_00360 [Streptomyces sp. WAC 05379]